MSDYLLEMQGISKSFSGVSALKEINIKIKAGECIGLCGENGAGKSTLMKVLSAVYPFGTWEGEILWQGRPIKAKSIQETEQAGIVIIHQELMLIPALTVTENIFLGHELTRFGQLNMPKMMRHAQALMNELDMPDVNVALPVEQFGGGQQQLIEIAKALNKNAKLLILDEPSSSLTDQETNILLELVKALKAKGVACVYISHKLNEIKAICDTICVIRDGQHIITAPSADMPIEMIIRHMVGRDMSQLYPQRLGAAQNETILTVKNMQCFDVNNAQKRKVKNVSFSLRKGEILGIAGLVGAGRTELVSAIFGGYLGKFSGELRLNNQSIRIRNPMDAIRYGICMVPEDRKAHGIIQDFGMGQNITLPVLSRFSKVGHLDLAQELKTIQREISKLQIKTASPYLPITSLSGGNQQKVIFSKMLQPEPIILILDEPTRGVDVGAKYEIYSLMMDLADSGISIIMVSSELPEILGLSDRVLVMGEGELRGEFTNKDLTGDMIMDAAINGTAITDLTAI